MFQIRLAHLLLDYISPKAFYPIHLLGGDVYVSGAAAHVYISPQEVSGATSF